MPTRDHLQIWINGHRHEVRGDDMFLSLSDFLRDRLRLVGTKIVCSEGDCGACSVLLGRPKSNRLEYQAIDACIAFLFQLDGTHVVTVEGLSGGQLTPVQQAMVDCHGSQCGFCTPGFVVAMHGHCEQMSSGERTNRDEPNWRQALTGNLCRCTGYSPILEAAERAQAAGCPSVAERYPPAPLLAEIANSATDELEMASGRRKVYGPTVRSDAVKFLVENPGATIVAGATDLGVQMNKRHIAPTDFLLLNRLLEFRKVEVNDQGEEGRVLMAGAMATWADLETVLCKELPQFSEILSRFGSPQIRHMGTLGGNIINASPIADSLPVLHVLEAHLGIEGPEGSRRVNINDFYQDYKQFDLAPGELLAQIAMPLPREDEWLRLYKITRRRDLDISTFTAAIRMRRDRDRISEARIAYGAVGPIVLRLPQTEEFLIGKTFTEETMRLAGDMAATEITPISDVRGSADYRRQLAKNVLLKFYHEEHPSLVVV